MRNMMNWPDIWEDTDLSTMISQVANNLEVYETENEVVVKANVAGVKESDIDLTFEKGVLYINASRTDKEENKEKKFYSSSSWSYSYKVAVPGQIDVNKEPKAEIEHGVLMVTFQKAEIAKPRKLTITAKQK